MEHPPIRPDLPLRGHVALVTGSTRGIGLGIARALHAAGCHVMLNGRDEVGGMVADDMVQATWGARVGHASA